MRFFSKLVLPIMFLMLVWNGAFFGSVVEGLASVGGWVFQGMRWLMLLIASLLTPWLTLQLPQQPVSPPPVAIIQLAPTVVAAPQESVAPYRLFLPVVRTQP